MQSIKSKILLALLLLNMLIISVGIFSYFQISKVIHANTLIYTGPLQSINYSRAAQGNFLRMQIELEKVFESPDALQKFNQEEFAELYEIFQEDIDAVNESSQSEESHKTIRSVYEISAKWQSKISNSMQNTLNFIEQRDDIHSLGTNLDELLEWLIEQEATDGFDRMVAAKSYGKQIIYSTVALVIFGLIFGILIVRTLLKQISNRIEYGIDIVNNISSGNLNIEIENNVKDEVGLLLNAMEIMLVSLRKKSKFAQTIALGKIHTSLELCSDNDKLGKALIEMQQALKEKIEIAEEISIGIISSTVKVSSPDDALGNALVNMLQAIKEKVNVAREIAKGKIDTHIRLASQQDILGIEFKNMIRSLSSKIESAQQVALGHANTEVILASDDDQLGIALNNMIKSLQERIHVAQCIANGDLTKFVKLSSESDDFGTALNETTKKLTIIIDEIKTSTNSVESATSELAEGTLGLSEKIQQQASALEFNSNAVQELTNHVHTNAQKAEQAVSLSDQAFKISGEGSHTVQNAISSMVEIINSSKKISNITTLIDDLAFQTNLLSLNATVEAARAGESGRGFAVVAAEIRGLSVRCAKAANEISVLIKNSLEKISDGKKHVDNSGQLFEDILLAVESVRSAVVEITDAGKYQLSSIRDINQAIDAIEEITHHNAAISEEAAASSNHLKQQVNKLYKQVSFFTLPKS